MKLETIALVLVAFGATTYTALVIFGLITAGPLGWLGLIPVLAVVGLAVAVLGQRLRNKEDDHYDNMER